MISSASLLAILFRIPSLTEAIVVSRYSHSGGSQRDQITEWNATFSDERRIALHARSCFIIAFQGQCSIRR